MKFYYSFPAVRGIQAGREYYISMVPLKLLSRLFPGDEEIVPPEFRAQRRINETRIPEIKEYILNNRSTYVFSALSASIDGEFHFNPTNNEDVGTLAVDMEAIFLINDGQHRKAAIEAAMQEDPELENETISIVFFEDAGLERSQQMFTDLNKHAVKTSNSLATLYDARDEIAVATKNAINGIPLCSLKLCRILAARYNWDLNHSYRVPGRIVPKQKIAIFDLKRAEIARREDTWIHFRECR